MSILPHTTPPAQPPALTPAQFIDFATPRLECLQQILERLRTELVAAQQRDDLAPVLDLLLAHAQQVLDCLTRLEGR